MQKTSKTLLCFQGEFSGLLESSWVERLRFSFLEALKLTMRVQLLYCPAGLRFHHLCEKTVHVGKPAI